MAISLNDNIKVIAPKPTDDRYLKNDGSSYIDISEVNTTIPLSRRYRGLTVNIAGVEYWYGNGISDTDLNVKTSSNVWDVITTDNSNLPIGNYKFLISSGITITLDSSVSIGAEWNFIDSENTINELVTVTINDNTSLFSNGLGDYDNGGLVVDEPNIFFKLVKVDTDKYDVIISYVSDNNTFIANHSSSHISGGYDEIDADRLKIDYTPINYTPTGETSISLSINELTSHLKGIDLEIDKREKKINSETITLYNSIVGYSNDTTYSNSSNLILPKIDAIKKVYYILPSVIETVQLNNAGNFSFLYDYNYLSPYFDNSIFDEFEIYFKAFSDGFVFFSTTNGSDTYYHNNIEIFASTYYKLTVRILPKNGDLSLPYTWVNINTITEPLVL